MADYFDTYVQGGYTLPGAVPPEQEAPGFYGNAPRSYGYDPQDIGAPLEQAKPIYGKKDDGKGDTIVLPYPSGNDGTPDAGQQRGIQAGGAGAGGGPGGPSGPAAYAQLGLQAAQGVKGLWDIGTGAYDFITDPVGTIQGWGDGISNAVTGVTDWLGITQPALTLGGPASGLAGMGVPAAGTFGYGSLTGSTAGLTLGPPTSGFAGMGLPSAGAFSGAPSAAGISGASVTGGSAGAGLGGGSGAGAGAGAGVGATAALAAPAAITALGALYGIWSGMNRANPGSASIVYDPEAGYSVGGMEADDAGEPFKQFVRNYIDELNASGVKPAEGFDKRYVTMRPGEDPELAIYGAMLGRGDNQMQQIGVGPATVESMGMTPDQLQGIDQLVKEAGQANSLPDQAIESVRRQRADARSGDDLMLARGPEGTLRAVNRSRK